MSDRMIDRLLSGRDCMSRPEKEAVLGQIFAQLDRQRPARRRFVAGGLAVCAALAGAVAVMSLRAETSDELTPRGAGSVEPALRVLCGENLRPGRCRGGETLVFDVSAEEPLHYFAALAIRPDGVLVWYAPSGDGESTLDLRRRSHRGVLDLGVVLGPDHPPGDYVVRALFASTPMGREQIRRCLDRRDCDRDTVVVDRKLRIE